MYLDGVRLAETLTGNNPAVKLAVMWESIIHPVSAFSGEWKVFMLFLIPVGGGIPGGVLLAKASGIRWPMMMALYFLSDVVLACAFEPILVLISRANKRGKFLEKLSLAFQKSMDTLTAKYGIRMGPISLILLSFGVDPMTGRVATRRFGYGFFSGWALSITGDLIFFSLIMISTLLLNNLLGDGTWTAIFIMIAMTVLPGFFRRVYGWWRLGKEPKSSSLR